MISLHNYPPIWNLESARYLAELQYNSGADGVALPRTYSLHYQGGSKRSQQISKAADLHAFATDL